MPERADRPYFDYSISQLEVLFDQAQPDLEILRALDHELDCRTRDRSARLHSRVKASLTTLLATEVNGATNGQVSDAAQRNPVTPIENLGDLPSFPTPKGANEPTAILAAWTALEALSPRTYCRPEDLAAGDRRCVANLSAGRVPWGTNERSRPKKRLYYQVILGSIRMERATEDLVKAFGEDEERGKRTREKAAIGSVLIDKDGIVVEENGIAVSSFAWALPLALSLKLGALGQWPKVELKVIEKLEGIVRRVDGHGKPVPLDLSTVDKAYRWLVAQFGLPDHLLEPPSFALRVYHYFKAKNPPEALLLNSFFLDDLARAGALVGQNAVPAGLRRYLGLERPKETFDLLGDKAALEKAVAPAMVPAARWPGRGGHPLVMLQQAAVNLVRSELASGEGILAVNGPPGTGKTTLLCDVVAACVLDRALAMASFEDPEKAFTPSGEKMLVGDKAFFQLYGLSPSLKGHEVLVASSNNKAVENVSKELPATKAVGRTTDELSYFKSVSDLVHGRRETADGDDDSDGDEIAPDPVETWGLIAAVLGNAQNRAAFQQSFWWHDDGAFRLYLKAAKGDPVVYEVEDPDTGKVVERRTPSVVLNEKPPSPLQAKANWLEARARLFALKREVDAELKVLEGVRQLCFQLADARRDAANKESTLAALTAQRPTLEADLSQRQANVEEAKNRYGQNAADVHRHRQTRPGFLARLFRTKRWTVWFSVNASLMEAEAQTLGLLQAAERKASDALETLSELSAKIRKSEGDLAASRHQMAQLSHRVEAHRRELGDRLVDERLFARGHEASNLAAPWIPDGLHRKREELFVTALAVHRAFIDVSAQKVLHNLSVLMDVLSSGTMQGEGKRKLLGDLWSTLFLVIPVISTTFASVDGMLGDLPVGSIGWLLIDEAGQALPQAAVGAVMRAKRSIVVGDPLQIPPVVTLPERLNWEICKFFKVDKLAWAAPDASAQTLADRASRFQAVFRSDQSPRRVGVPLLVHRRCQEPMFGISNRIAYDGQMVHAPGRCDGGAIGAVLGPSKWLDIDGEADSKWCPVEGELVVSLLRKIAAARITDPDLFIITPFRIVAQELRRRLEREGQLFSALRVAWRQWVSDRVGTIHTVQGREANAVILVLGAPNASVAQANARNWAAGTPNILNVAVSRAKENFYTVGSYGAWSGVGYARKLASSLPRTRP